MMVCESEPVPPRRIQPKLPATSKRFASSACKKTPAAAIASAAELAEDLRRFQATEPIVARPTPLWERGWKWTRRRPAPAALLALSLVVLVVGFPLVFFLWLRADRSPGSGESVSQPARERCLCRQHLPRRPRPPGRHRDGRAFVSRQVHARERPARPARLGVALPAPALPCGSATRNQATRTSAISGFSRSVFIPATSTLCPPPACRTARIAGRPMNAHDSHARRSKSLGRRDRPMSRRR